MKLAPKKIAKAQPGGRPPGAVEIAPEGVLAAAVSTSGEQHSYAFVSLTPGALVPSIDSTNLLVPDAVSAAIRSALGHVAPRKRAVTLVLPDTLVRVFILDFDSVPTKQAEAVSVVRFRLRKMVPFDVESAGVSYQVISQGEAECKVLVAVIPGPVLTEYELAVRDAGYEPGAVLSSSLAALEAIDGMEAVMAANLSSLAITTTITNGQDLLLYRTIDLPPEPTPRLGEIQRSIAVAAAYYEDKLGARPRRLRYAGIAPGSQFAQDLADPEFEVVEWVARPGTGNTTTLPQVSFAGVTGALVGAG